MLLHSWFFFSARKLKLAIRVGQFEGHDVTYFEPPWLSEKMFSRAPRSKNPKNCIIWEIPIYWFTDHFWASGFRDVAGGVDANTQKNFR